MSRYLLACLLLIAPLGLAAQTSKPAAAKPAARPATATTSPATARSAATSPEATSTSPAPAPQVVLQTSQGAITLELFPDKSPKSVANFLQYVHDGFYAGTVFHRAIPGYLLQGGLYTRDLQPKRTRSAIASEADNGLSNLRGTVAVARGADPNSGTAQFFINLVDNRRLDYVGSQSGLTWGYAVFGKVVQGMDVVDKIAALPTRGLGPFAGDVPNPLVVIERAFVVGEQPPASAASSKPPAAAASVAPRPAAARTSTKHAARR